MHLDAFALHAQPSTPMQIEKSLSGPHRKLCEGIVAGLNQTEAYRAAYPRASYDTARNKAAQLVAKGCIQAEIERLREKADAAAGSAVLTLAEKRAALAAIVRAKDGVTAGGIEVRAGDVVRAIALDSELAPSASDDCKIEVTIGGNAP
jgi:phage terminase small subunit